MARNQAIDQDWALVVGIQNYPGLAARISASEALRGPVNDANDFVKWLTDPRPQGAAVPPGNIQRIIQQVAPPTAGTTPPTPFEIEVAQPNFRNLFDALSFFNATAAANRDAGLGLKIGRRLYLYLAGHGIEPGLAMPGISPGPALLMANATAIDLSRHILAKQLANWLYTAAYFDEILLFMDCCRDNTWQTPAFSLQLGQVNGTAQGRFFYAFGTRWDRRSRELEFDGQVHGVFTKALLEGLRGAASDPVTGKVTVGALRDYLPQIMDELAGNRLGGLPPQKPDFEPANDDFVIADVPPKLYTVTVPLPPDAIGRSLQVHAFPSFQVVKDLTPSGPNLVLDLPRGAYAGQFTDKNSGVIRSVLFSVPRKLAAQSS